MSLTTTQQISIGRICSVLASNELNQGKQTGGQLDEGLPLQLWAIAEGLEMLYDLDPSNIWLTPIGNDLISKCRHYARATTIINSGGTSPDISNPTIIVSPIQIRGDDFSSALSWTGTNGVGVNVLSTYTIQVFWNELNRFLIESTEWTRTATGFDIIVNGTTITGFDATGANSSDIFLVFISI